MILKELITLLEANNTATLHFMLPLGNFIADHFHITEVGRVEKVFMDCGGVLRTHKVCVLQVWTALDVDHRLIVEKLIKILKLAATQFYMEDLAVEVEYGDHIVSLYNLTAVEVTPSGLLFVLSGKQTGCLAPDKCGVECDSAECCTPINPDGYKEFGKAFTRLSDEELTTMVDGNKRSGVKAHLTDKIGIVDENHMIRGEPGGMMPVVNDQGVIEGFSIACPACGIWGGISFVKTDTFTNPWRIVDGNPEDVTTLSVTNSILKYCCGWHGYLTNGVFVSC